MPLTFSLFNQKQKSTRDLTKESASFLWHQMLLYVFKQMPHNDRMKNEMLDQCVDHYRNNQTELETIEQFRKSHTHDQAISWCTDEYFLYKLLNQALRTENIQLLYSFRFLIIDLCGELERDSNKIKSKGRLTVYRGQMMHKEELQKLQHSMGGLISTNGYFSTSRDINISLGFLSKFNSTNERVFFEIQAAPQITGVVCTDISALGSIPYISIQHKMLRNHVSDEKDNYDLALEHAERALHIRKEQKPVDQIRLASTLNGMGVIYKNKGDLDRASDYYQQSLAIYENEVSSDKRNFDIALQYFNRAYEIYREILPAGHPRRAHALSNIGSIYHHRENLEQALSFYQQALDIQDKTYPDDHLRKVNTIRNIVLIYRDKQDWDNAMNCLNRALNMYRNVLDDKSHPSIAVCHSDIGHVYEKKGNWDQALDYYRRQLKMEELCLSIDHPHLGLHFDWIVNMLKKKGNIDEAKQLCQQELKKLPDLLGSDYANHSRYTHTLVSLATILEDSDFNKSQDYYKQTFSVLERQSRSTAHRAYLSRTNLSSNNKELPVSLRGLARLYQAMNNDKEATKYFNQSLDIFQVIYGPEYNHVKEISNELDQLKDSVTISNTVDNEENDINHHYTTKQPMPDHRFESCVYMGGKKSSAGTLL
ncbi:unnamed protein product [Rotaria socialis]|uniref:Uncharacterized protein n=1 Tax=Rotaria socialis TaxID=392032 RepID=A0A820ATB0_9BILA|nr:unnamed protein product [Rotaria socialis]CAF3657665.1 unnamed protein product [Rotaria socialis]CAF4188179.1 unnamed protein product [Rotaria socialis]CAF4564138.1 unnamed protein product [Rotaria socialis]